MRSPPASGRQHSASNALASMPTWRRSPMARERALWARATALCAPVKALLFGPSDEFDEMPFVEDDALRLRVACALVIDAQHGWPAEHRLDTKALQVWELYHTVPVKIIRYLTVFAYLLIAFAETPGWCVASDGSEIANCTNATTFQRYETLVDWAVLPTAWALFLEGVCLSVFSAQLVARIFMLGVRRFLRSRWHLLQLLLLGFMFADVLMAASPALWQRTHFTRPMRAAFVVCSHRRLRDTSAAVVLMMPRMLEVLVLFAGLLALTLTLTLALSLTLNLALSLSLSRAQTLTLALTRDQRLQRRALKRGEYQQIAAEHKR